MTILNLNREARMDIKSNKRFPKIKFKEKKEHFFDKLIRKQRRNESNR